jgi:hypothetical protein
MNKKHKFLKIYVPDEMMDTYEGRTHHNPENWTKLYYYNSRKCDEVPQNKIVNELVGCGQYQNNMFYKIATMCRKDKVWDYYRVLKKHPYQEVAIKSSNSRTKTMDPIKITHYPKDKPYVLKFN